VSNIHDDDDDEQAEDNLRGLRQKAKQTDELTAANALLQKQLMFAKAGIDVDSELGQMLLATHAGDDLAELKAKAARLGALTAPATSQDAERGAEDQQRAAAQAAASNGQPVSRQQQFEGEHPVDAALVAFQQDLRAGRDPEQARIDAMAKVLGAAQAGDTRVLFDRAKHDAAAEEADRANNRR
jgi:hypothetical protein